MFSRSYNELYIENILAFQKEMRKLDPETDFYNDFYPCFGVKSNENAEFLIYGQAPNGWRTGFNIWDSFDHSNLKESALASNKYIAALNLNPLDWVNIMWSNQTYDMLSADCIIKEFYPDQYRVYRSFFWNVVYKFVCDYYKYDRESWSWSSKIVWSNLYKIAPENANPNGFERNAQNEFSIELLRKEIEEINPKYCVCLTNIEWWLPFQTGLRTKILSTTDLPSELVSIEKYNETEIIITKRPRFGDSELFASQILGVVSKKISHK
jgi:hypothetical protein